MGKHTPGPWTVTPIEDHYGGYEIKQWAETCCAMGEDVAYETSDKWQAVDAANAVLIEATPDLLAACEDELEWLGQIEICAPASVNLDVIRRRMGKLQAAIDKAERVERQPQENMGKTNHKKGE